METAVDRAPHQLDQQPGSPPDIRMNAEGVTFIMAGPPGRRGERLIIRCDSNGELWISIKPAAQ